MKLLTFDFTVVYKAGKENLGVDSLSRMPLNAEFLDLSINYSANGFSNWQNSFQAVHILVRLFKPFTMILPYNHIFILWIRNFISRKGW